MTRTSATFSFLFPALLLLAGCGGDAAPTGHGTLPEPEAKAPPSLLLIVIDTWRWDHIGISGAGMVETPNLDRLAAEGVYAGEIVVPCPLTTPAHASLFTGLLPSHHGVLDCVHYALPDRFPTLAEAFRDGGYATAAFVSAETVRRRFGLGRGFDHYDDSGIARRGGDDPKPASRDGGETTDAAIGHLRGIPGETPVFLWVHYFDLHYPYRARPRFDPLYPGRPYAAQAAFVDAEVGRLLKELGETSDREWRVVVVGDHGEGLGDHGELGHGYGLYRSTLHVPLILHPKPAEDLRHPAPWGLSDLPPTLLEWFGLPPLPEIDGESLFSQGDPDRFLPSLSLLPAFDYGVNPSLGIRRGSTMYIRHGREELYDLASDPGEMRNVAGDPSRGSLLKELRKACDESLPIGELEALAAPPTAALSRDLDSLRGLGYLGGMAPDITTLQWADLGELLEDHNTLELAREDAFESGQWYALFEKYDAVLEKYPRAASACRIYGKILLARGKFERALPVLARAVELNPEDSESAVNLGALHIRRGDARSAQILLQAVLDRNESDALAHKNMAILCEGLLSDPVCAARHYSKFLELVPDSPDAQRIRAFIEETKSSRRRKP